MSISAAWIGFGSLVFWAIGASVFALVYRRQALSALGEVDAADAHIQALHLDRERLSLELRHTTEMAEERLKATKRSQEDMDKHLQALCLGALQQTQTTFLEQSQGLFEKVQVLTKGEFGQHQKTLQHLVEPLSKTLTDVDERIRELEKVRVGAYEAMTQQIHGLASTQRDLFHETHQLVQALRTPNVRGKWGEHQLRRLVEATGMIPFCDFEEQGAVAALGGEGRLLKPDMVIKLPGGQHLAVDAKVPLFGYLEGLSLEDPAARKAKMKDHVRHIRAHIKALSKKDYWSSLPHSPEFVLLFLPLEALMISALEFDPDLLDYGLENRVLIATPMTLLALLKTTALGWRHHSFHENAQVMSDLGHQLSRQITDLFEGFRTLGRHLQLSIKGYNATLGLLEETIVPTAQELGRLSCRPDVPALKTRPLMGSVRTPALMDAPSILTPDDLEGLNDPSPKRGPLLLDPDSTEGDSSCAA